MSAGIYIHWPFCERKCPYCDFYTFGREHPSFALGGRYLEALVREIAGASQRFELTNKPAADTIYLGGGTPSLMGAETVEAVLHALREVFDIDPAAEITIEINPTTAEAILIDELLQIGVNRLSVGCQSFNDRVLKRLGRVHDAATTRRAIEKMREAGVANLSLDLIFGAPTQTIGDLKTDLDELLTFEPEHVSAYNMTVHEGTPFARHEREGRLTLAGEDEQVAMFELMMDRLAEAGYEHYEISNWARPGFRSRHNSKYWRRCDVYAFGVAAHGVIDGIRYENPRDLANYLNSNVASSRSDLLTERSRRGEIMMLALRRVDGVDWSEIDEWMQADARAYYRAEIDLLAQDGLIEADPNLRLTRKGILIADTVMEAFF
ncbi:radical SAM family heme chaperone HemW [bacterium]|nr:radical SAM family heme chaperone HemW [bacterium]